MTVPMQDDPKTERALTIARRVVAETSEVDRRALLAWAEELLRIRESTLTVAQKARAALRASLRTEVATPLLHVLAEESRDLGIRSKKVLWDDRGWGARLALGGITLGTVAFGSQGAGIAALGGAIGVPLWLVLGAGGAFLGCLIEELRGKSPPTTSYTVIEALPAAPASEKPDRR
jgi:hypothetical protein